jgi:predicted transcriptional regulator
MTTVNLDETLITQFKDIAVQRHTSLERIVNQALQEYLEDYLDILAAEQVLAAIERGEEKIVDWSDVKRSLYDMES